MEPLYTLDEKWTFELYEAFAKECSNKLTKMNKKFYGFAVVCLMLAAVWLAFGHLSIAIGLAVYALILPFLYKMIEKKSINKVWNSNKIAQNMEVHASFYEDRCFLKTAASEMTITYDKFYKLIATDAIFAMMFSSKQGICFWKTNCSDELLAFLKNKISDESKWV